MTTTTRFLTGGIASLAVASAVTLGAPAAQAADLPARDCGQPAVPATYVTVFHDPVLRQVPAVTHEEWRWQRDVTTYEQEYTRTVTPAHSETDWTRDVPGTTEYLWSHVVIDQQAIPATPEQGHHETVVVTPAVTVTMFEYVQQQTGNLKWAPDGWNGEHGDEDNGKGWAKTGNTRIDVVTPAVTQDRWVVDQPAVPAVPEQSHVETAWAPVTPGSGWTGPSDSRVVGGGTETTTTTGDDVPEGDGWTKVVTRTFDAVTDTVWALTPPDGYAATGASRVHDVTTEETDTTSADAPSGDGWTKVVDSRVVVVDEPASSELVGEGWSEQVLVDPALPATAPCPTSEGGVAVAGPSTHSPATGHTADVSAAAAPSSTVLPATGNPVSALLVSAGLGALVAGSVLVRGSRRRRTT
jgi:hypothetical protein